MGALADNAESACPVSLEESDRYRTLERASSSARKYGRVLALAPFVVALFITLGFKLDSVTAIEVCLVWGVVVAIISFFVIARATFVDCPSCDKHFGPGMRCQWCGFPRTREVAEGSGQN
jgi:hypothetical protein